jgi:hypothetical protein
MPAELRHTTCWLRSSRILPVHRSYVIALQSVTELTKSYASIVEVQIKMSIELDSNPNTCVVPTTLIDINLVSNWLYKLWHYTIARLVLRLPDH